MEREFIRVFSLCGAGGAKIVPKFRIPAQNKGFLGLFGSELLAEPRK
jgi:hypothetical protein